MNMISNDLHMTIVGVGPGDPDMLTIKAQKAIASADLVVGFQTVLNVVETWVTSGELCHSIRRSSHGNIHGRIIVYNPTQTS